MQNPISHNLESESEVNPKLSIDSVNGYYISFLAIGVLIIILKFDLSSDLKQGLFFILLWLIFGAMELFKSASRKEHNLELNKKSPRSFTYNIYNQKIGEVGQNTSDRSVMEEIYPNDAESRSNDQ